MAKFAVNSKIYLATKISLFMANYDKELIIEMNIIRKGKVKKIIEFAKRMKKVQEEVEAILRNTQKEIK